MGGRMLNLDLIHLHTLCLATHPLHTPTTRPPEVKGRKYKQTQDDDKQERRERLKQTHLKDRMKDGNGNDFKGMKNRGLKNGFGETSTTRDEGIKMVRTEKPYTLTTRREERFRKES